MKLRLLITTKCNRQCKGCCNKDFDVDAFPKPDFSKPYEEIIITGGEPQLKPDVTFKFCRFLKEAFPQTKVIVYTADIRPAYWRLLLPFVHGLTVTLHTKKDLEQFKRTVGTGNFSNPTKSLRLNSFPSLSRKFKSQYQYWQIKDGIKWLKNCPLPEGEEIARLDLF